MIVLIALITVMDLMVVITIITLMVITAAIFIINVMIIMCVLDNNNIYHFILFSLKIRIIVMAIRA